MSDKRPNGRDETYRVSEESKLRARESNPNRSVVETPDGMFQSINEAAQHYNISPSAMSYRCKMGQRQRTHNKPQTLFGNDYRGFKLWTVRKKIEGMPIVTPLGTFSSMRQAAIAHGCSPANIRHRVLRGHEGYYYVKDRK